MSKAYCECLCWNHVKTIIWTPSQGTFTDYLFPSCLIFTTFNDRFPKSSFLSIWLYLSSFSWHPCWKVVYQVWFGHDSQIWLPGFFLQPTCPGTQLRGKSRDGFVPCEPNLFHVPFIFLILLLCVPLGLSQLFLNLLLISAETSEGAFHLCLN